jgi:hypothetical protein
MSAASAATLALRSARDPAGSRRSIQAGAVVKTPPSASRASAVVADVDQSKSPRASSHAIVPWVSTM